MYDDGWWQSAMDGLKRQLMGMNDGRRAFMIAGGMRGDLWREEGMGVMYRGRKAWMAVGGHERQWG